MQHTWLRWLRGDEEPNSRSKIKPCVRDQIWVLQENIRISINCHRKGTIIVVPGQLLGPSAIILLSRGTRVRTFHPVAPRGAVGRLGDLSQVDQARSLLLEVSKHVGQNLPANLD